MHIPPPNAGRQVDRLSGANNMKKGSPPAAATGSTAAFINQLFTAINFQVTQQDAAAQAEGNIAQNLILLYRAMGGGWQIRQTDRQEGGANTPTGDVRPLVLPQAGVPPKS